MRHRHPVPVPQERVRAEDYARALVHPGDDLHGLAEIAAGFDRHEAHRAVVHQCHSRSLGIHKAFQFLATRMERYIVACYDAQESGHFRPHRDNTTKGTAHRRFAVSLFLNTDQYEGGDLRFPEYGSALYSAPVGGAVVFSCSLLHEATPVTRGRRYMFLPFLYDDAARRIREENFRFLDPSMDRRVDSGVSGAAGDGRGPEPS